MRNDKEYGRSEETKQVDNARRRLLFRIAVALTLVFAIGWYVFIRVDEVLSTQLGREGFWWGVKSVGVTVLVIFLAYVAAVYIPIFKVMPKGEIIKPRNWGKGSKKNREAA